MIRPQEPQPDLLGNLLHEHGVTHAKRMVLSFGVYALLLAIHIWLPAKLLLSTGLGSCLPILRPKFWYLINRQLQVPIELLVFHLTLLGFLEKYKNNIGSMQHRWLAFMCGKLGMTDNVLPKNIEKFILAGWKPIFLRNDDPGDPGSVIEDEATEATPGLTEATGGSVLSAEETPVTSRPAPTSKSTLSPSILSPPLRQLREVNQVDPFWYDLAAGRDQIEEFVTCNMISAPSPHPCHEIAISKPSGERTVVGSKPYIRLPLPAAEQDAADRRRRRLGNNTSIPQEERKNVIPTKQGPFRLRRAVRDDGTMVIEFWKEVRGGPISRPPEGWDDLGVGGAEVQGRWAWVEERKSTIEEGVAHRASFFRSGISVAESIPLVFRILLLAALSWAAITLVVCSALNLPLVIGRGMLYVLRIPDTYMHDPFAFALGLLLFCPLLAMGVRIFDNEGLGRIKDWSSSFRRPSPRKGLIFSVSIFSWFILVPVLLGTLYNLVLVKPSSWFAGEGAETGESPMLTWSTGTLLLSVWAFLAHYSVFTREFWVNLGNPAADAEEENENENEQTANEETRLLQTDEVEATAWQGKDGRVAAAFSIFSSVVGKWQWDRVDPKILLADGVIPITKHLMILLVVPSILCIALVWSVRDSGVGVVVPVFGLVSRGMYRMVVFRALVAVSATVQYAVAFRAQLDLWFKAAHKAARDDRYLTGQVLLDYSRSRKD